MNDRTGHSPATDVWKAAVDQELVTSLQATADDFESPQAAIKALIRWHVDLALYMEADRRREAVGTGGVYD